MKIKFPYGTTEENNRLVLPEGMLSIDLEKKALRIHDGVTQGGFEMLGTQAYTPEPGEVWARAGERPTNLNGTITDFLKHTDGKYYAASGSGIRSSADLSVWDNVNPGQGSQALHRMKSVNGYVFTAWSTSYQGAITIASSLDGSSWAKGNTPGSSERDFNDIVYFNGMYIVCTSFGRIYTSTNRTTWTQRYSGNIAVRLIEVGGVLYGISNQFTFTSTDGLSWVSTAHNSVKPAMFDATYFKDQFIQVGTNGSIATSVDAINWTPVDLGGVTSGFTDIVHNGSVVLAVSLLSLFGSSDGANWAPLSPTLSDGSPPTGTFRGLAFVDNSFYAPGISDGIYRSP